MNRSTSTIRLDLPGADVTYTPGFLQNPDQHLDALQNDAGIPWAQEVIRLYGEVPVPRLTAFHGDSGLSYRYSGNAHPTSPWTPALRELQALVEQATGERFNSVLLNLYRSGGDSVSWHADDEPEMGKTIASISLGAERRFQFRQKNSSIRPPFRAVRAEQLLQHGSLIVMGGDTQTHYEHCVPKTTAALPCRINLTFRQLRQR